MENTIEIIDIHKKANIYRNLCIYAEDSLMLNNGTKVFDDWIKLDAFTEKLTNFKGILFQKENEYVICYIGTESKNVKDHIENIIMGVFGKNMQMRIANYFYTQCKKIYGFFNENLTLIGHSEGGTEASYVGVKNNVKVVTFNPFGLSKKLYDSEKDYTGLITNYRDASDLVSKLKNNPGKTYIVEPTIKQCFLKNYFGSIKSHKILNFGDCETALELDEYKKTNSRFLNSYKIFEKL